MFWKKKEKIGRVLVIPEEKAQVIYHLWDAYLTADTHETKYLLWKEIAEIFPEIKKGQWRLNNEYILTLQVKEIL